MDYSLYADNFRKRRLEVLEAAGYQCQDCGADHGAIRFSVRSFRPYINYLHVHHPDGDKKNPHARLHVLCSVCHFKRDLERRRRLGLPRLVKKVRRAVH